jgi:hypothetical protein
MALLEVVIAGVLLGVGLAVVLSLVSRSLASQGEGERQLTASWLVDELLSMVLVEGPALYPRLYDTSGRFAAPFDNFTFDIIIEDQGIYEPYRVTATVRWPQGRGVREVSAQTLIADRGQEPEIREPAEAVDRMDRWYGEDEQTPIGETPIREGVAP